MLQWGHDLLIVEGAVLRRRTRIAPRVLQWGHDLLIVEGRKFWRDSPLTVTLQWGHDLLIVEGHSGLMGQRFDSSLQWGHDLLIVEGAEDVILLNSDAGLQWGHDLLIVEGSIAGSVATRSARASMGPRSVDRGRQNDRPMAQRVDRRFNGATIC